MRPTSYRWFRALSCAALFVAGAGSAFADDWKVTQLKGLVFALRDQTWIALRVGDVVSDSSPIHTFRDASAQLTRDQETIDMGADTEVSIFDRIGERFTTVREASGQVTIHANVESVKHFSVMTPFVSAVVKGTIFSVTSNSQRSDVNVMRGVVGVDDNLHGAHVDVTAGQSAGAGFTDKLQLVGTAKGDLEVAAPARAASLSASDRAPNRPAAPRVHWNAAHKAHLAALGKARPVATSAAPGGNGAAPGSAINATSPGAGGGVTQGAGLNGASQTTLQTTAATTGSNGQGGSNLTGAKGSNGDSGAGALVPGGGNNAPTNALTIEHDPGFWVRLR